MQFEEVISSHSEHIKTLMTKLHSEVLNLNPIFEEAFAGGAKVKMVYYFIEKPTKVLTLFQPGKDHVKVFLHHFDKLDCKEIKLQGSGKHSRHFRLFGWDDNIISELKEHIVAIKNINLQA